MKPFLRERLHSSYLSISFYVLHIWKLGFLGWEVEVSLKLVIVNNGDANIT